MASDQRRFPGFRGSCRGISSSLTRLTGEDTSIVVFGSLARSELTSGSDLDWVLLVDGFADPES